MTLPRGAPAGTRPQPRYNAADLAALEKWLTPAETMAFLHDREAVLAWCAIEDGKRG